MARKAVRSSIITPTQHVKHAPKNRDGYTAAEAVEVPDDRGGVYGYIGRLYLLPGDDPARHRKNELECGLCAVDKYVAEASQPITPEAATRLVYLAKAWERELWPETAPHVAGRTFTQAAAVLELVALQERIMRQIAADQRGTGNTKKGIFKDSRHAGMRARRPAPR